MHTPQQAKLDGPGPFVLPIASGFLGLANVAGQLPVKIRLVLSDGRELRLPIEEFALNKMLAQFADLYRAKTDKGE